MTEHRTIQWEGRDIRLSYTPRWATQIDHVEFHALDGKPLPVTDTGYRSHFFGPVDPILTMDEVEGMMRDWLDSEAAKPAWQEHVSAAQQLSLF